MISPSCFPVKYKFWTLNEKKYNYKTVNRVCKRCQNIFIGLKKTCLGVLEREKHDKDDERGLKEGGGIEMSTTVLPFAMHALHSLWILTIN